MQPLKQRLPAYKPAAVSCACSPEAVATYRSVLEVGVGSRLCAGDSLLVSHGQSSSVTCSELIILWLQDSEVTHVSDTIELSSMPIEDSYKGPRMKGMGTTQDFTDMCVRPTKSQTVAHRVSVGY